MEKKETVDETGEEKEEFATYSLAQAWTFGFLSRIFAKGARQPLEYDDLLPLDEDPIIYQKIIEDAWEAEVELLKLSGSTETPSFGNLFLKTFGKKILLTSLLRLPADIATIISPLLLKLLVSFIADSEIANATGAPLPAIGQGVGLAFAFLLLAWVASVFQNQQIQRTTSFAITFRCALLSVIYRKAMRLSYAGRQQFDSAKIVSMCSTDCARIEMYLINWYWLWVSPLYVVAIGVLLLFNMGWPMLVGYGLFALMAFVQSRTTESLRLIRNRVAPITDERVRKMQELILGIKVVKLYAWENAIKEDIRKIREPELAQVLQKGFTQAQVMTVAFSFPIFAGIVSIVVYAVTSSSLDVAIIFATLSWFTQMRQPLFWLPYSLAIKADADVGYIRISQLLAASEYAPVVTDHAMGGDNDAAVIIKGGEFMWESARSPQSTTVKVAKGMAPKTKAVFEASRERVIEQPVSQLVDINLRIAKGSLTAIVGSVGSGKSTFLQGLIGECTLCSGDMMINGRVGFAPQQPWIQNSTIKENILFGQAYDESKYLGALQASCLEQDLFIFPDGDLTQIGERGITLSGGQKQRLSIARLVYASPDIALLDDPLAAVDIHVGRQLFEQCITGALGQKTRILVTHQLQFLPLVDQIIVLREKRIVESGSYKELVERNGEFAQFLKTQHILVSELTKEEEEIAMAETVKSDAHAQERIKKMLESKSFNQRALMQVEERNIGTVPFRIWSMYWKASGGWLSASMILALLFQADRVVNDYWIVWWTADNFHLPRNMYICYYFLLGVGQTMGIYSFCMALAWGAIPGSRLLHHTALERILQAPLSFYETTPVGRIMSRFSKDVDGVDTAIGDSLRRFILYIASFLAVIIVIIVGTPIFLAPFAVIAGMYIWIQNHYRKSSREIKRIESISRSPLYAQIGESLLGLGSIRAYKEEGRFLKMNEKLIKRNQRPYYTLLSATQWLSIRLEFTSGLVVFFAAIFGVTSRTNSSYSAGSLGLSLVYALQMTQTVNILVKLFIDSEIAMNMVERLDHFGHQLEQEAPFQIPDMKPKPSWPDAGVIEIRNISARYAPDLPLVLKNITLTFQSNEKIGIVGRTGSGKSTLISLLFRTIEPAEGAIFIDGVNTNLIGLHDLRSKIAIIPQDPVLFSGTVRSNLDPFGEYEDLQLWEALESAFLKVKVSEMGGLEAPIQTGGENLSVGERQLLCMARALARKARILVMDEATANVDVETDEKIQRCLRQDLAACTLVTIAHRIDTIRDYSRIVVLEGGVVAEFDSPDNLMKRENGIFRSMCEAADGSDQGGQELSPPAS